MRDIKDEKCDIAEAESQSHVRIPRVRMCDTSVREQASPFPDDASLVA